jgi:hypothetical protein
MEIIQQVAEAFVSAVAIASLILSAMFAAVLFTGLLTEAVDGSV